MATVLRYARTDFVGDVRALDGSVESSSGAGLIGSVVRRVVEACTLFSAATAIAREVNGATPLEQRALAQAWREKSAPRA
jgi:hypothetical protein